LREPTVQGYFEPLKDHKSALPWKNQLTPASSIIRKTNLTKREFDALVRSGQPFVVDDCATNWPYRKWSCKDFGDAWPSGHMKAEYSEDQRRTTLGDGKWWHKLRDGDRQKQHISNGSMVAGPYIWHVKDEEPLATKRSVQQKWQSPYFFNSTAANHLEAWDSFEFWFSLPGGGAFAHSDSYCEMTISTQLRGRKIWRLMMYPETRNVFESFQSFDTGVYGINKWSPEYEFEVGPGQCFLFPPGYMHETIVPPENNTECSVATTFQYNLPFPTKYIRNFLPRLFSSHLIWAENCHSRWEAFHSLQSRPHSPSTDMAVLQQRVDAIYGAVDANKDGYLETEEIYEWLRTAKAAGWARQVSYSWIMQVDREQQMKVRDEQIRSRAEDTVNYSDLDGDDKVSVQELLKSTHQWNVLNSKFHKLRKLNVRQPEDTKKALKIEKDFHQQYSCGKEWDSTYCLDDKYFEALGKRVKYLLHLNAYQNLLEEGGGQPQGGSEEGEEGEEGEEASEEEEDEGEEASEQDDL